MRNRRLLVAFLLLSSWLLPAAEKQQPMPKDLPPYGALRPVETPAVIKEKLANGLTVWLVPEPGFPKVAIAVSVRGGRASDPAQRPGISDVLSAALDQGTPSRTARQIAQELQAAGGDFNATATADSIDVSAQFLSEKAASGLSVLSDIVENASFPDNEVQIAKRNQANSLQERESEPHFLAFRALYRVLFGEHPYHVTAPTAESIAQTTPADLRNEFARRFRPDQAVLVAAGDFDPARMLAAVGKAFGPWKAAAQPPLPGIGPPSESAARAVYYVARPGSVQTTLYLGALAPTRRDPDYPAALIANAIYGGMFGSRLVLNIREDKGYTYSPGSAMLPEREAGVLRTRADVRNPVTGASLNEIDYELNRLVTTTPSDGELNHAKRYLVGSQAIELQSRASLAQRLATLWVQELPPEELGAESARLEKVSAEEADQAAKKYFSAARMTVVAVGEEKVIRDQLSTFGLQFRPAP